MSATDKQPTTKPRRRRWLRRLTGFTLLLLAAACTHAWWLPPLLERAGPWAARTFAGYELELSEVRRADWHGLAVGSLSLHPSDAGSATLQALQVEELEVAFDVLALWRGELTGLHALSAASVDLRLAQQGAPDPPAKQAEGGGFTWPEALPPVSIGALTGSFQDEAGNEWLLDRTALELGGSPSVSVRVAALRGPGDLRLDALHLDGRYAGGALTELRLEHDTLPLLVDSDVDLRRLADGALRFELRSAEHPWSLQATGELESGVLRVEGACTALPLEPFSARWPGLLGDLSGELGAEFDCDLSLADPLRGELHAAVRTGPLVVAQRRLLAVEGELAWRAGVLEAGRLELRQDANHVRLTDLSLPLDERPLGELLALGRGALEVSVNDLGALLDPPALPGEAGELPAHELRLSAHLEGGRLVVDDGHLTTLGGELRFDEGALSLGPAARVDSELSARAAFDDLSELGRLLGSDELTGRLSGVLRLQSKGGAFALDGRVEVERLGWRDRHVARAVLDAYVARDGVRVRELSVDDERLRLECTGSADPWGTPGAFTARVERLLLGRGEEQLATATPIDVAWTSERWSVSTAELHGSLGHLHVSGRRDESGLALELESRLAGLGPLLSGLWPEGAGLDALDADVALRGASAAGLSGDAAVTARGLVLPWSEAPLTARLEAAQGPERFDLTTLTVASADEVLLSAAASLPLSYGWGPDLGPGLLELVVDVEPGGLALFADAAPVQGLERDLRARLALRGEDERLEARVELQVRDRSVVLAGELRPPRELDAWLSDPAAAAERTPVELALELSELRVEELLRTFSDLLPADLPLLAGRLQGGLEIGGTLAEPTWSGDATLAEAELRFDGLPRIDAVRAALHLDPAGLRLDELAGELGGAPFEVTGELDLVAGGRSIDVRLTGSNLLLYRQSFGRVRSDVDVHIAGPLDELVVSGKLHLTQAFLRSRLDLLTFLQPAGARGARGLQLFRLASPALANMRFALDVTADDGIRVSNTAFQGGLLPRVRLEGTGELPLLHGTVFLEDAQLRLPGCTLDVKSGSVRFDRDDPFLPRIAIDASKRIRGYDVHVVLSGRYDSPEVTLSSDPPLSGADLVNLLTSGRLSKSGSAQGAAAAQALAIYVAKDLFAWWSGGGHDDSESVLDRITVEIGQDVSRSGADTLEATFRLADDVWFERDSLLLATEHDKYDDYNFGLRVVFRFE